MRTFAIGYIELIVIGPFEMMIVPAELLNRQVLNVITVFTCGPVLTGYVLPVTASVHEPKVLVPVAVLAVPFAAVEEMVKVTALLVNCRVVATPARAGWKTSPLLNTKALLFRSTAAGFITRAMAGFDVTVIGPFETVRLLLVLLKLQILNVITSFTCGPVPEVYVLLVTVKMQEPKRLLPVAVPPTEESIKVAALLTNARVVATFVRAGWNTAPFGNVNAILLRSSAVACSDVLVHPHSINAPAMVRSAPRLKSVCLICCMLFSPYAAVWTRVVVASAP
jgi:hypothetical protein